MSAMPANLRVETVEHPRNEEIDVVRQGLNVFNRRHMGEDNYLAVSVFVRDERGKVLGGAVCAVYWNAFSVEMLWIDDAIRGQGLGTQVMEEAEAAARRHGCAFMHVDTMSFQALEFYQKIGFVLFGTLPGYAGGVERYYLYKPLV